MSKHYGFSFDADRCLKCRACEIACLQWHGIKAGTIKLRRVEETASGTFPNVKRTFRSVSCRHCAKAPCAAACPSGAIQKREEDGVVTVDRTRCTGCRACFDACPMGIPQFGEDGTMQKCDMCLDRIDKGQVPVCAATCPTQALQWGTVEDLSKKAFWKTAKKLNDVILPIEFDKEQQ